jgi:hypothetical protein
MQYNALTWVIFSALYVTIINNLIGLVMSKERFHELLTEAAQWLSKHNVTPALAKPLNHQFPANGDWYEEIKWLCQSGSEEGWLCKYEAGGIRYGQVFKPSAELANFSVDVVLMSNVVGPHHSHPNGEIDLVIPLAEGAAFDGTTEGWKVYEPGSAHKPTVSGGEAFVIYLLPDGAINFTT